MKTIAFVGNPNVGKTAWINVLSHSDFKVGNWPGVTVEKKEAVVEWEGIKIHLIDLPGIYNLTSSNNEEKITQDFLANQPIDCIVQVADATNLGRNLYLTLLLRELQIPMIILLNFEDEVIKNGIEIDLKHLQYRLQIPLLSVSALDETKREEVKKAILYCIKQDRIRYPLLFQGRLEAKLITLIKQYHEYHPRYSEARCCKEAINCLQNDEIGLGELETQRLHILEGLMKYVKQDPNLRLVMSRKIDRVLLHPLWGVLIMLLILSVMLLFVFNGSNPYIHWLELLFSMIGKYIRYFLRFLPQQVSSLVVDGLLAGVGGVLSFIPLMAFLYFGLALLEESGYIARIAFLMDRMMSKFHLSGKAFVSFLLGFGCNVPAIASTRILEDEQSKRRTALLIPFMSCGAKLPVYVLFATAFFKNQTGLILITVYGIGILVALLLSTLFSRRGHPLMNRFFVIELPPYRKPTIKIILNKVKQEVKAYYKKATSVVLWAMLILWALSYFPNGNIEQSYLAQFGKMAGIIYEPLGFGNRWQLVASLPGAIIAKETVVGYLAQTITETEDNVEKIDPIKDLKMLSHQLLISGQQSFSNLLTLEMPENEEQLNNKMSKLWSDPLAKLRAFSFIVYILLSIPCVMTLYTLYRHYGIVLMLQSILLMIAIPYLGSFIIFQFFNFIFS